MSLLVVMDIDGTISDATDRFRLAGPDPGLHNMEAYLSWVEAVNDKMHHDTPVSGMAELLRALWYTQSHCVYLTNREEKHREVTENWLTRHGFPRFKVMMRQDGSYSEAIEYKGTVIRNLCEVFGSTSVVIVDDDESGKMEGLCKKMGWTFLKARSGGQV
jgi:hypothetical protein